MIPSFRPRVNRKKYRYVIGAVVLIVILVCGFRTYPPSQTFNSFSQHGDDAQSSSSSKSSDSAKEHTDGLLKERRIAKASMLYGSPNDVFERALKSHDKHNDNFGYPLAIMRQEITKGYWTKLSYLLSLIVLELGRPADERIEWIMWNDADVVLLNPQIPLSIFLPPNEPQFSHVNFIGSRNEYELDARSFFIRVDPWSLTFLVKAMAVPLIDEGAELGVQMDQNAMAFILNETEFRNSVFYQPHTWFNALRHTDKFEGKQGTLLAGFSGDELKGERWRLMDEMVAEAEHKKYEVPVEETTYTQEIQQYWDRIREARTVANDAEQAQKKIGENVNMELMGAWETLKDAIFYQAYDGELMRAATEILKRETQKALNAPRVEEPHQ